MTREDHPKKAIPRNKCIASRPRLWKNTASIKTGSPLTSTNSTDCFSLIGAQLLPSHSNQRERAREKPSHSTFSRSWKKRVFPLEKRIPVSVNESPFTNRDEPPIGQGMQNEIFFQNLSMDFMKIAAHWT